MGALLGSGDKRPSGSALDPDKLRIGKAEVVSTFLRGQERGY